MDAMHVDNRFWEEQDDILLNQANPVSGTEYEVLPETANVKLRSAYAVVTWTLQPNPLEIHVYCLNTTKEGDVANPVSTTTYGAFGHYIVADGFRMDTVDGGAAGENITESLLQDRLMRITAETTGGTVNPLQCRVKYATFEW